MTKSRSKKNYNVQFDLFSCYAFHNYISKKSGVPIFETENIHDSVDYIIKLLQDTSFLNDISMKQHALAQKYDWKVIAKATEDFILQ